MPRTLHPSIVSGATVWLCMDQHSHRSEWRAATIGAVGREYADLNMGHSRSYRMVLETTRESEPDVRTVRAGDGHSPQAYLTRESAERKRWTNANRAHLIHALQNAETLDLEKWRAIAQLVGMEAPEPEPLPG